MTNKYLLFFFLIITLNSCKTLNNKEDRGIEIMNKGVGGNSTKDLRSRIDVDVLNENPDLVILMVGTNDLLNSEKMLSYAEYTSNLNTIVEKIKGNGAQVLMISSPPVDSVYLFQRHDKSLFKESPNVKMAKANQIVEGISKENKALYLDLFSCFTAKNIPSHNQDVYIRNIKNSNVKDGVHPTPIGYKFIAETVYQYLSETKLLKKYKIIICFGDSITKGAGAKGAGTTTGENYPSFLRNMLNEKK